MSETFNPIAKWYKLDGKSKAAMQKIVVWDNAPESLIDPAEGEQALLTLGQKFGVGISLQDGSVRMFFPVVYESTEKDLYMMCPVGIRDGNPNSSFAPEDSTEITNFYASKLLQGKPLFYRPPERPEISSPSESYEQMAR